MYAAEFLRLPALNPALPVAALVAVLAGCAETTHTLENTSNLTREELVALCADLEMRAKQDCTWNVQQQPSSMENRQTWEVNCQARRDSARRSYENVCLDGRTELPEVDVPPN
jgi:hypothetical protein